MPSAKTPQSEQEGIPPHGFDSRSETRNDHTRPAAPSVHDMGPHLDFHRRQIPNACRPKKRLRPGEMRLNLELAEFVQSALSHRMEPVLLHEWQASMQRRCLLHRFPCRLWYDFIYDWQVGAEPSRNYTYYPVPERSFRSGPTVVTPTQQTFYEIRIDTTPFIFLTARTTLAEPVAGQPSVRIHRL